MTAAEHNAMAEDAMAIMQRYVPRALPEQSLCFTFRVLSATSARVKAKYMVDEEVGRGEKKMTASVVGFEIYARVWRGPWGYRVCIYQTYSDSDGFCTMRFWHRS